MGRITLDPSALGELSVDQRVLLDLISRQEHALSARELSRGMILGCGYSERAASAQMVASNLGRLKRLGFVWNKKVCYGKPRRLGFYTFPEFTMNIWAQRANGVGKKFHRSANFVRANMKSPCVIYTRKPLTDDMRKMVEDLAAIMPQYE